MNNSRKCYLDILRVISALAVVFIHVLGAYIDKYPLKTTESYFLIIFDSIIRWSVPVFVMISGAVMLRKEYSYKEILFKALRIMLIYVLWSFLYALYAFVDGERLKNVFSIAVTGATHLWYLPLIAGLYLMIPIFYKIISDKRTTEYVLIVGFIVSFMLPTLAGTIEFLHPFIGNIANELIDMYSLPMISGYPIYFLLGYYVDTYCISKKKLNIIKTLSILSFGISVIGNVLVSTESCNLFFSNNLTACVFLQSLAIFLFFKSHNKDYNSNLLSFVSRNTFGIYLIHYVFTQILGKYIISTNIFIFILFILISSVIIYLISMIISFLIKKIPVLNKLI